MYFPYSATIPANCIDTTPPPIFTMTIDGARYFVSKVEKHFGISIADKSTWQVSYRAKDYNAYAYRYFDIRKALCLVLRENSSLSCKEIARLVVGNNDHAMTIHNVKQARAYLEGGDEAFKSIYDTITHIYVN
jgi:hypothetical protein